MDHKVIEAKWQKHWQTTRAYEVEEDINKPKYYCLEMFPYPSGKLHMGHVRNYTIGDAIARYKRLEGYNVLHPIGWDSFGLPAENAAIKHNIHPKLWTYSNIDTMKKQLKSLGLSYSWNREFATSDPAYYKWEQYLFIQMFEKGLAYKKKSTVNWCETCSTVLANEQVENGACWRCEQNTTTKELEQWFFKITDYAKELLDSCDELKDLWPERVLTMQKNWIGESYGVEIDFKIKDTSEFIKVYTTRADTIYGVTYISIAPEHPLVNTLCKNTKYELDILKFIEKTRKTSKIERTKIEGIKEGVFTGSYAINPLTQEEVPIYLANFVLLDYGTGAVMAVPAHDQRDFEFAKEYNLNIKEVIYDKEPNLELKCAFTGVGTIINSDSYNSLNSETAKEKIASFIEENKLGKKTVNYKLKDWGISRQRFWGCPIPIIYCDTCGMLPASIDDLPILLPDNITFEKIGDNPLAKVESFYKTVCPKCNTIARRETDTFDTFVESSWYYARYTSSNTNNAPLDLNKTKYWLPVDQYIGGIEHAILHLIYIRFFHKVLRDFGYLTGNEPVNKLLTQGMVIKDGFKMSKSKGNVVDPDYILEKYGADTARLFSLFASPPEKDLDWSDQGIEGAYRFIQRVYRFITKYKEVCSKNLETFKSDNTSLNDLNSDFNKTLKKISNDFNSFSFNTAIASMMEFTNTLYKVDENDLKLKEGKVLLNNIIYKFLIVLYPLIPHLSQELFSTYYNLDLDKENWPKYDENAISKNTKLIVVQVNGKIRSKLQVDANLAEEDIKILALSDANVIKSIDNCEVKKIIYIKDKLLSIVI